MQEKYINNTLYRLCECGCNEYFIVGKNSNGIEKRFIHGHNTCKKPHTKKSPSKLCECGCGNMTKQGSRYIHGHNNKNKHWVCSEEARKNLGKYIRIKPEKKTILPKLCECGCKEYAKAGKRFICGHNIKDHTPWNKGLKNVYSKETLLLMAESKIGKKNSKESIEKRIQTCARKKLLKPPPLLHECGCGCGELIKIDKKYIHGHNNKGIIIDKEIILKRSGEKHWNFQGWKSRENYSQDWSNELKEQIRKRDGYICQVCLIPEIQLNKKLSIHHIDYNKENCSEDNLISLCTPCHMKTNKIEDREKWQSVFASQ